MRLAAALKFTFLTGVFQIGLGIFRLGAIVHYVSYPVMVACNSAGACDTWTFVPEGFDWSLDS